MGIKTNSFYHSLVSDFKESFANTGPSYYVFGSDLTADTSSLNSERSSKLFLEKTIFGKKIEYDEVRHMI